MNFIGADIETSGDEEGYALQPWRVKEGTSRITMISAWKDGSGVVAKHNYDQLFSHLRKLKRKVVFHNTIFDLAFLYASGVNFEGLMIYDSMLLCKWKLNGQRAPMSYSLADMSKLFLPEWSKLDDFIEMKNQEFVPGENEQYWTERATLDAEATALIADTVWEQLTPQQQRLASIQAMTIPLFAMSWVNGIHLNIDSIHTARPVIVKELIELETKLDLCESASCDNYIPSKVLRSPKQLGTLLYDQWSLPCEHYTEKGARATSKMALVYLSDTDDRLFNILKWKELNTILSKFIDSPVEACEYLGSNIVHPSPKIFSTYTGRATYGSKTGKKKTGIAIHQIPRKKEIRSYIIAPDDHYIFEFDAAAQEMRGMAIASEDERMQELFNSKAPFDDSHSLTGSAIACISFEEFLKRKSNNDPEITGGTGYRALGKFCNLGMGYMAGNKTLRRVARVQYGIDATERDVAMWKRKYLNLFPGVKDYWITAPNLTKSLGYAETVAGRRYKINKWRRDDLWSSKLSSINFPIQAGAADQKELALATIIHKYPEMIERFLFELHDGFIWKLPKTTKLSYLQSIIATLNNIDYKKIWGVEMPIPLLFDGSFGETWGSKVDFDLNDDGTQTLEDFYYNSH